MASNPNNIERLVILRERSAGVMRLERTLRDDIPELMEKVEAQAAIIQETT